MLHSVQKFFDINLKDKDHFSGVHPDLVCYKNYPQKKLSAFSKTFSLSDICILHEDLVSIKVVSDVKEAVVENFPNSAPNNQPDLKYNAFEKLLIRILKSDRTLSAKTMFKILAHEAKLEEDSRLFDTENVLLDHIDGVIVWKDTLSKSIEKRCKIPTLANKLSNIRKNLI